MPFQKGNKIRLGMKNSDKQKEVVRHYMKTRTISKETLLKMSKATKDRIAKNGNPNLGKKFAYKARPSMSARMKGENNPAWKGGTQKFSRIERVRFRRTIQAKVFERDNYTCQLCGIKNISLQVDHIQSWADYVELRFSMDNCRTLCQPCHYLITFGKPMPKTIKTWGHNLKFLERKVA